MLLLPDLHGRAEESDWELIEKEAAALAARIIAWTDQVRDRIKVCRPALPAGIKSRFREKWAPLRRVAELAGGRWPAAVDQMALADKKQFEMDREDGMIRERPAVLLLKHLMDIWPDYRPFMPTTEVVSLLVMRYPDSWGSDNPYGKALTAQRLGRMLANGYRVNSFKPPTGDRARGYRRSDLEAVCQRVGVSGQTGQTGRSGQTGRDPAGSAGSADHSATPTEAARPW